ncbi:hypothetical protein PV458_18230 [Streptomyces sp. MN03-5084-2B]|nr:hypothetical protein [Streptomyces sp. MN03-5084-2B]
MTRSPEWAPPGIDISVPNTACGAARGILRTRPEVSALSAGIDNVEGGSAARDATDAGNGRKI